MITNEDEAQTWLKEIRGVERCTLAKLELFIDRLREENTRQNLVSAASVDCVWRRHICDSAQLLTHVSRETIKNWLDLGTGAGFPGLIIAAIEPGIAVTMVESRSKRVDWLRQMIAELELENATVVGQRVERLKTFATDAISARAFAPLGSLLELASRFSTSSTKWLLPKGRSASQELAELKGWRHMFHVEQSLTDPDAGIVVGSLVGPGRL